MPYPIENPLDGSGRPVGGEIEAGRAAMPAKATDTHAYLGVVAGLCTAIRVDQADGATARFVSEVIRNGGYVERVPLATARTAYLEPWPSRDVAQLRAATAELNAVSDRLQSRSPAPPATRGAS